MIKKLTKKQVEMQERLKKYSLTPEQYDFIMSEFCKGKAIERNINYAVDKAIRYKNINEGKKVRDFLFIYKNDCKDKRGVYKITFGDSGKFYVGSSKLISARFSGYRTMFKKFFTDKVYNEEHYLRKVFEHLNQDSVTYYFIVELLEEARTVESLFQKEQAWLNRYKGDDKCLNVGFVAVRPECEIEESVAVHKARLSDTIKARRGGRLVFYSRDKKLKDETAPRKSSFDIHDSKKMDIAQSVSWNIEKLTVGYNELPSVYKIFYGEHFLICKSLSLSGGIYQLQKMYGYYLGYDHKIYDGSKNYNYAFYEYIRKHPGLEIRVEVLLQSSSGYDLLMKEQTTLDTDGKKKKCLNSNVEAYVNKFNEKTGKYNWLEKDDVDKFYESIASTSK